jgi:hypothetical protein
MSRPVPRQRWLAAALAVGASLALSLTSAADAHVLKTFGPYTVALGWKVEPTYVGAANAVQLIVTDTNQKAVTDIPDGSLTVVVSAAGQTSAALPLNNAFDEDTALGTPGDYEASIVPTVPGAYTFHLTGTIHGTSIDETATSSDSTFDPVVDSSSVDFPTKLPSIADLSTRMDRLEARASAVPGQSPGSDALSVAQAAQSAATDASNLAASAASSASVALQVGILVGAVGIVIGVVALALAIRRRPGAA